MVTKSVCSLHILPHTLSLMCLTTKETISSCMNRLTYCYTTRRTYLTKIYNASSFCSFCNSSHIQSIPMISCIVMWYERTPIFHQMKMLMVAVGRSSRRAGRYGPRQGVSGAEMEPIRTQNQNKWLQTGVAGSCSQWVSSVYTSGECDQPVGRSAFRQTRSRSTLLGLLPGMCIELVVCASG